MPYTPGPWVNNCFLVKSVASKSTEDTMKIKQLRALLASLVAADEDWDEQDVTCDGFNPKLVLRANYLDIMPYSKESDVVFWRNGQKLADVPSPSKVRADNGTIV